uniref:DOMON domain-containing protein n=1 Tax=Parastrongyloides trichosuri TaxID=131310 RepID=A0A0N4ZW80_PARTI
MNYFLLKLFFVLVTIYNQINCELCELKNKQGYKIQFGKDKNDIIHFELTQSGLTPNANLWYAVGFGRSMLGGLDVIMIRIINGKVFVTDEFVSGYSDPTPDFQQDVSLDKAAYVDGTLTVRFSRPIVTKDSKNDIPLRNCFQWNFVMNPGNIYDFRGSVAKHPGRPFSTRVCLDQCLI